ncbi:hypothetical protein JCM10296v2_002074 [Rhodotorula toruloides]
MSTSGHASTSSAPAFPRVGDTFPSLNEFKLACHRAALYAGVELMIASGNATRAQLNCRLREHCTARKISGDRNCTFRITACQQDGSDCGIGVVERELGHSCPRDVRRRSRLLGETEAWTLGKIEELEEATENGHALPPKASWRRTIAKPASSSEDDNDDNKDVAGTSTDEEETWEEDESSATLYPSAAEVSGEIADLLKAGSVGFPACQAAFSSARKLLITLYAFAQARAPALDLGGGASTASDRPKREADKPLVQHAAFLPASTPFIPTPLHVEDLAAFLYSIFPAVPAHELQLVVTFLAHIGLSTLEDLAVLLNLEPTMIQYLVNAVQLPSLNSLDQASMRAALHRCLETIRQQAKVDVRM